MMATVSSRARCKGRASTSSLRVSCPVRLSCPRAMIFGNANSFSVSGNLCPDFGTIRRGNLRSVDALRSPVVSRWGCRGAWAKHLRFNSAFDTNAATTIHLRREPSSVFEVLDFFVDQC